MSAHPSLVPSTAAAITGAADALLGGAEAPLTYELLVNFHLDRISLDDGGSPRPVQVLKNQRSNINKWIEFHGLTLSHHVGEELGVNFVPSIAGFCSHLEAAGNDKQTISDRKSTIQRLRKSHKELTRSSGLPEELGASLCVLAERAGESLGKVARKIGIPGEYLYGWAYGRKTPSPKSLPHIRRLEDYFKVPRGTLSSRLPEAHWSAKNIKFGNTAWRRHLGGMIRLRYTLKVLTPGLREEWDELLRFYTDEEWLESRGMSRNSVWRVRWNTNRCETGACKLKMLSSFLGFLRLPDTEADRRMRGLGLSEEILTLAMLGDARLVKSYLRFMRARTVSESYNSHTINFISFACQLLRPDTGYLWQSPQYAARLPLPVPADEWQAWCEKNLAELAEFGKRIRKGKEGKFRKTHDPFDGVREIIEKRRHPVTALFEVVKQLESLTPLLQNNCPVRLALNWRNIFLLRFIASNPLRIENFSMMTYIPKEQKWYREACEAYSRSAPSDGQRIVEGLVIETDMASNLYQRPDGSWWLRFDERDFKNERGEDLEQGILHAPYDVMVVESVWPALREYLFGHRPALNRALREDVNVRREKHNLAPLSCSEEVAIEECRYVFRPTKNVLFHMGRDRLAKFKGTEQMCSSMLSRAILVQTQKYLPNSPGFSAHACRHLVATEYIKNHPEGESVAAAALHNQVLTVRKHYAWVTPSDRIKPWNDHHEDLYKRYEDGEI